VAVNVKHANFLLRFAAVERDELKGFVDGDFFSSVQIGARKTHRQSARLSFQQSLFSDDVGKKAHDHRIPFTGRAPFFA
jgi:hypothetical protein